MPPPRIRSNSAYETYHRSAFLSSPTVKGCWLNSEIRTVPVKALVLSAPGREPALPDQHALVPPVGHVPDPGPELEVVVQTFSSAYSDGLVAASRDPHLVERGRVSGALFAWASPHQASLRGVRPVEQEALPADGRYPDPGSGRQFRRVAE